MTVHFIGAGPGAPDLITVRGLRLIERCPVCLYAGSLVPAAIVARRRRRRAVIDTAPMHLDEIIAEMQRRTRDGPGRGARPFRRPVALRRHRRADPPAGGARHRLRRDAGRAGLRRRGGGARTRAHPARGEPDGDPDAHRRCKCLGDAGGRGPRDARRRPARRWRSISRSAICWRSCASWRRSTAPTARWSSPIASAGPTSSSCTARCRHPRAGARGRRSRARR